MRTHRKSMDGSDIEAQAMINTTTTMKAKIKFKICELNRKIETKLDPYHGAEALIISEGKRRPELQKSIFGIHSAGLRGSGEGSMYHGFVS